MIKKVIGRVHSLQSLGTVDGPGVRFVVFMQGCPLRCGCCHNPDTQNAEGGTPYTPSEILEKVTRCRDYFGDEGGLTVSGGEPLMQADFVKELFTLAKRENINTCLDTSGCILTEDVKELLSATDRVLLDIKYSTDALYERYVGCKMAPVLSFLRYLDEKGIKTTLRQVIIPTLNDDEENILFLKSLKEKYRAVDKIELLPFKKICKTKYDALGIPFPFEDMPTPTSALMKKLSALL
jgi:pyruvate formate lyase activating enzyme